MVGSQIDLDELNANPWLYPQCYQWHGGQNTTWITPDGSSWDGASEHGWGQEAACGHDQMTSTTIFSGVNGPDGTPIVLNAAVEVHCGACPVIIASGKTTPPPETGVGVGGLLGVDAMTGVNWSGEGAGIFGR